jgi:hypothetical protein
MTTPVPSPRPRPILLAQSLLAAAQLIVGAAGFAEHVPAAAAWWIITGMAAVQVGLAFYLQGQTTPLSDPQDARGVPLVPADVAQARVDQAAISGPPAPDVLSGGLPTTTGGPVVPE